MLFTRFLSFVIALIFSISPAKSSNLELIRVINSQSYGLPESLVLGVAHVESRFNARTIGSAGEIGIFQMKPATAKYIGCASSRASLFNATVNIHCGLKHLKLAYVKCGTIAGAAKLHNAGLGASCTPSLYSSRVIAAGRIYTGESLAYNSFYDNLILELKIGD